MSLVVILYPWASLFMVKIGLQEMLHADQLASCRLLISTCFSCAGAGADGRGWRARPGSHAGNPLTGSPPECTQPGSLTDTHWRRRVGLQTHCLLSDWYLLMDEVPCLSDSFFSFMIYIFTRFSSSTLWRTDWKMWCFGRFIHCFVHSLSLQLL